MDIAELFASIEPKIGEGNEFLWPCFGKDAWGIDMGEKVYVIYDLKTQQIYQIVFYDYEEGHKFEKPAIAYVWNDLRYEEAYLAELKERNITDDLFTENYIDLTEIIKLIKEKENVERLS